MMPVPAWIVQLNKKLSHCSVTMKAGRDVLYLRASLPSKKDPSRSAQQEISTGMKEASADRSEVRDLAFKLDEDISLGAFSWSDWTKGKLKVGPVKDR